MWVLGKVEPGWYLAAENWDEKLALRWEKLGYQVLDRHDYRKEILEQPKEGHDSNSNRYENDED